MQYQTKTVSLFETQNNSFTFWNKIKVSLFETHNDSFTFWNKITVPLFETTIGMNMAAQESYANCAYACIKCRPWEFVAKLFPSKKDATNPIVQSKWRCLNPSSNQNDDVSIPATTNDRYLACVESFCPCLCHVFFITGIRIFFNSRIFEQQKL